MLVLSRKNFQTVEIDGGIRVTVLETRNGKVKLGFEAPSNVPINRGEVQQAKERKALTQQS